MEQPPFWGIAPSREQAPRIRWRDGSGSPAATAAIGALVLLLSVGAMAILVGDLLAVPEHAVSAPASTVGPGVATKATRAPVPQAVAPGPTTGRAGRDGSFAFAVRGVDCGDTRIGDSSFGDESRGVFCLVDLRITNVGNEARTFDASSQFAVDTRGRRHEPSSATTVVDVASIFLDDIGPGASVNGTVVFDVPVGTRLRELELHDSPFSGGVRLGLQAAASRPVRQACRRSC
jgi:hypothetical protein